MLRSLALVLALLAPTPAAGEDLCSECKSIWHFFAWLDTNWLGTAFREIAPWNGKWSKPTVLYLEGGGFIHEHMQRWREVRQTDADIEIRGPCFSACTLIMAVVPKERLCFGVN
jgi:hypothetical protein